MMNELTLRQSLSVELRTSVNCSRPFVKADRQIRSVKSVTMSVRE